MAFKNWWVQEREVEWSRHSDHPIYGSLDNGQDLDLAIYVKLEQTNNIRNRDLYLKYIGAQNKVKCPYHKFCLITKKIEHQNV